MPTVREITEAIEEFAPIGLQESYDNAGLQVGNRDMEVEAVLLCLDVTEEVIKEAKARQCNMIVSHHPLIFKGLKEVTYSSPLQRIVIDAIRNDIAIYSAHTNLDSAWEGVSYEMAHMLGLQNVTVLEPKEDSRLGLGIIGDIGPLPKIELLRKIKNTFNVKCLKYSAQSPQLVVRKVALCGGAGSSLLPAAINSGADIFISGDLKYHDFTGYGTEIIIADVGHYESEICTKKILSRIIRDKFPDFEVYFSETEVNPIKFL